MSRSTRATEQRVNNKRTYQFGKSRLTLQFGDITTSDAAVIVSSDDYYLTMGGGVSSAIRQAAGDAIILDAAKKVPAQLGDVVVTSAGALKAQYIFHAITIGDQRQKMDPSEVLDQVISKCFDLLVTLRLHSISLPAIGTGSAGFNLSDVAIQMAKIVAERLMKMEEALEATIYLYDRYRNPLDYIQFFEEFRAQQPDLAKQIVEEARPKQAEAELKSQDKSIVKRQELIDSMRSLDAERDKLEDELIRMGDNESEKSNSMRVRINTIQNERLKLKAQLKRQTFETVELFISYAHKDEALKDELNKHLTVLQKQGAIASWHDRKIIAGEEWKDEIDTHLESAQIILLLISPDFMASNYCYEIEMQRALERHESKEARVIPVILRPVSWSKANFSKLQALPKDGKPVTTWTNQDEAFVNVIDGLLLVIEQMRTRPSWSK
jgi:O-acetyl-ADP-ribose deacetylase (regulator of RNase III)